MQSDDGAPGSKGSHADDDGSTVVVAAAAAAKAPEVDTPVVDPKPAENSAAKSDATRDATRDATQDAPVSLLDRARHMADGRPDRDGRRKALTDKAQGNGTAEAPAKKKATRPARITRRTAARAQDRNTTASSREPWLGRTSTGAVKPVQQARGPGESPDEAQEGPVG